MTLEDYEVLTGTSVAATKRRFVDAQIDHAQRVLEELLGYTLEPDEVDDELSEALSPFTAEAEGTIRLFPYNSTDRFLHVDPFTSVHSLKLVKDSAEVKTFDVDTYRVDYGRAGWSKFLEANCGDWFLLCQCDCRDCYQLMVDADWLWEDLPEELQYVWADMVGYYSDQKTNIRTESIGAHSYSKFDNTPAEDRPHNRAVIQRFAGPYGRAARMPV